MYRQSAWAIRTEDENGTQETIITDGKQVYASLVKAARAYEQEHPGIVLKGDKHQIFRMADGTPIVRAKPIYEKVKASPEINKAMTQAVKSRDKYLSKKKMWRVEVIEVGGTKRVRTLNNKKEVWPTMIGLMNEYKQQRPGLRFCRDDRKENKIELLSRDKQLYIYAYPL